jgi:hypothetical protein
MDQSASPPGQQPFRFLDLPKELRLMIYERLIVRPTLDLHLVNGLGKDATMRIVTPSLGAPILLVCKTTYAEAVPVIKTSRSTLRVIFEFSIMDDIGHFDTERHRYDYTEQDMYDNVERMMKAFAKLLSAARGSESFMLLRKATDTGEGLLLQAIMIVIRKYAIVSDSVDTLRRIWDRVRTELYDVVEIALRGQQRPLSGESVDRLLQVVDFKRLSRGVDIVVYEAPQMHAEADGAAAVHEEAPYHSVIDEKTWNEKWV